MAKRSKRKSEEPVEESGSARDAAINAYIGLLAERKFAEVGLDDIAERAGLSLSALRAEFPGKIAILAGFSQRIDLAVLASGPVEGESERDRLFDILMRRLDAMTPYRAALVVLSRGTMMDPALGCALACASDRSMKWMLAAARVQHSGFVGRVAVTGTGVAFAQAMNVWLADGDSEKTMAALDRALRNGERAMGLVRDAFGFLAGLGARARDAMRGDRAGDAAV